MSNPTTRHFTRSELQELYHALLSAFPTVDELKHMVRFELDEQLEHIAAGQDLGDIVFNLITWAEAQGQLVELIQAARNYNPENLYLQQVAQLICPLPIQSSAQLLASLSHLQLPPQLVAQSPALDMDEQQDTAEEQQHVIFMPDAPQTDDFARYAAGLNLLLTRLGNDHARYAEAMDYAQQLYELIVDAEQESDDEQSCTERDAIIAQLNGLSLQTLDVSFAALCAAGCE
jgi:hypothetical protein